jgi:hypothetical protein
MFITLHDERNHEATVDVDTLRIGILDAAVAAKVDDLEQRVHELFRFHAQPIGEIAIAHHE